MQIPFICEKFGWTYEQYFEQPAEFIELIKRRLQIDAQKANQANK